MEKFPRRIGVEERTFHPSGTSHAGVFTDPNCFWIWEGIEEAECFSSFQEPQAEWEEAEEAHPEEVEEVHLVVSGAHGWHICFFRAILTPPAARNCLGALGSANSSGSADERVARNP